MQCVCDGQWVSMGGSIRAARDAMKISGHHGDYMLFANACRALHLLDAFMSQFHRFNRHVVSFGVQRQPLPLGDPCAADDSI